MESLAFNNPTLKIYLVLTDGNKGEQNVKGILHNLTETYKNIVLVHVQIEDLLVGTSLEKWYHCNDWKTGPYHVSHLSDALRFLILYKYGGYYFDLDVIHVRPVTFYRNFAVSESRSVIGSSVLHFEKNHEIMRMSLEEFPKSYK